MVTLSPSQKKTAFAVALLALIAVGVMVSGRGGFTGLRSDAFNNPSFVCTEASMMSGEMKYTQAGTDIAKLTAEKTKLQALVKKWSSDIKENEALLAKSEKEKTAAEKNVVNIEKYIKDSCSVAAFKSLQQGGRAGNGTAYNNRQKTCNQKKNDLQKAKQNVNTIQAQIAQAKAAIAAIGRGSITNTQGQIPPLEQKIQTAKNYREDYETCKRALVKKPSITSVSPEVGSVGTIITLYGSGFTSQSTVLIGDAVIDVTPTDVSPNGDWLKVIFPQEALVNYLSDIYSLRVSNVGNVSVDSGLASNSVLFSIIPAATCDNLTVTPTSVTNGGSVTYTCSGSNATSYSIVAKRPDGSIFVTSTNAAGSIILPTSPLGTYAVSCFINGQTTTPAACQKTVTNTATTAVCGNGIVEPGEQCDDGNTNNDDSCNNQCQNNEDDTPLKIWGVYSNIDNYVAAAGGSIDEGYVQYCFNKDIRIMELKMEVDKPNSVASIRVGDVSAPVVNGVAWLTNLNAALNYYRCIGVYISYPHVGTGGVPSGTESVAILTSVNGSKVVQTKPGAWTLLVGSKPTVTVAKPVGAVVSVGNIKAIEVTVTADAKGDITLNSLPIKVGVEGTTTEINTAGTNTVIVTKKADSSTIATTSTEFTYGVATKSGFSTVSFTGGYLIPAGTSQTFQIYIPVTAITPGVSGSTSLSTSLSTGVADGYGFSWTDTAGNASSPQTVILNTPYITFTN